MARYDRLEDYAQAAGFDLPEHLKAAAARESKDPENGQRRLDAAITGAAEEITKEYLRPAFDALLAEVRRELPANTATNVTAAFAANPKGQAGYRALLGYTARYAAMLGAAGILYDYTPGVTTADETDKDMNGLFIDSTGVKNGNFNSIDVYQPAGPPREDEPARLLWLAHTLGAAFLWSPKERRQRFERYRLGFA